MAEIDQVNQLLLELKQMFTRLYENELESVILFGSQARGEANDFSDIDLLTVLKSDINPYQEIDRTNDIIAQSSLENDVVISCHFISSAKFHQQDTPFLANVKREGILL